LDQLIVAYPDHLWIDFSEQEQKTAWEMKQDYSCNPARWNAYMNRICISLIIRCLQEYFDLETTPTLAFSDSDNQSIWEVVNGTMINLETTKIVIIPSEAMDTEEFTVPQEWIDIPGLIANYYLAVQVNLYDRWIRIWGYATHKQLKDKGRYDQSDRTYSLDQKNIIEDLNVMWLSRKRKLTTQSEISSIPKLSLQETENILIQLAKVTDYSPRLELPFEKWAAIMNNSNWRKQLYEKRIAESNKLVATTNSVQIANNIKIQDILQPIKLKISDWLDNNFNSALELGWQTIEMFLTPEKQRFAFRSEQAPVKQGKLIDLGVQLGGKAVVLLIAIAPETTEKVQIRIQVHPANNDQYLPANLKLSLISETGENLQTVQSRSVDNFIQLGTIKGIKGESFGVSISLENSKITEFLEI
jgi:hypothetical protein